MSLVSGDYGSSSSSDEEGAGQQGPGVAPAPASRRGGLLSSLPAPKPAAGGGLMSKLPPPTSSHSAPPRAGAAAHSEDHSHGTRATQETSVKRVGSLAASLPPPASQAAVTRKPKGMSLSEKRKLLLAVPQAPERGSDSEEEESAAGVGPVVPEATVRERMPCGGGGGKLKCCALHCRPWTL